MSRDDLLGEDSHQVQRAPAEVDDLLGMIETKLRRVADMPGVGRAGRVAVGQRGSHGAMTDRSPERTVPDRLVFSVPSRERHPHLDGDVRIVRGSECGDHPAERGQTTVSAGHRSPRGGATA